MTWIKICGITNLEDALMAVEAGADALGFVFYEKSPRKIDAQKVRGILAQLATQIEKVGVFINGSAAKVAATVDEAGLTAAQLYADEQHFPEKQLTRKKIFLSLPAQMASYSWRKKGVLFGKFFAIPDNLAAILVDSGPVGGTGKKFNWEEARTFFSLMGKMYPMVAAGGLSPDNVSDAIRTLKPWGVDVSSGVEARPGKKDPEKVRAFIAAVREAEKTL